MDNHLPNLTHLRAVLEAMLDPSIAIDISGRIVLINQQIEHLFGYQQDELLGKFVEHLMPARFHSKHIHHRHEYSVYPRATAIVSGLELFGLKKDGTEFPIEIRLNQFKTDKELLILASMQDISNRKKIEENAEIFSAIVQFSDDAIISVDLNGIIVSWNKGSVQLYGYSAEETIGKHIELILTPEHKNQFESIKHSIQQGETIKFSDTQCIRKDGKYIPVSIIITPLKNSHDKIIGASTIARNITEQKYLEQILRDSNDKLEAQNRFVMEASRLKSEFLANMSHELRTPLSVIIGFAKLMHKGLAGPVTTEHKDYLEDILTNSNQLLNLINDVLDLSKIEAGKMEYHNETINVQKLINEIKNNFYAIAFKKNISLETGVDLSLNKVTIDSMKFKQIINNYISNAIKFTPNEGRVTIRLRNEHNNTFRLEVEDTGIGIRKEDLNQLFIAFKQLDSGFSKTSQGSGLGLALTRNLVEGLGGKVGVDSTLGKGSTFYAILPCSPPKKQNGRGAKKMRVSQGIKKHANILLIESESSGRLVLVETLIKQGYSVETAETITEVVQHGYHHRFDAIIIDLFLPDMKYWNILRKLRSQASKKRIPALVTTIIAEKKVEFYYRIHDFLIKPVVASELLSALLFAGVTAENIRSILIVDNDQSAIDHLRTILQELGYRTICESKPSTALQVVKKEHPDVIVLDPIMLGAEGFNFLYALRKSEITRYTPIVILTRKNLTDDEYSNLQNFTQRVVLRGTGSIEDLVSEFQSILPISDYERQII